MRPLYRRKCKNARFRSSGAREGWGRRSGSSDRAGDKHVQRQLQVFKNYEDERNHIIRTDAKV